MSKTRSGPPRGDAPKSPAAGANPFDASNPWAAWSAMSLEAMESFSRNMAEAAARSQALMMRTASEAKPEDALPDPDPLHIGPDAARVFGSLASHPDALINAQADLWRRYMALWSKTANRYSGADDGGEAGPVDKRFRSKDWSAHPYFEMIKESYLLTSDWLVKTLESVEGVDDQAKRRVAFFAKQFADAFSPTNFPMTNPDVVRTAFQTGGESFLKGVANLAEDLERGRGRLAIRQTDLDRFKVGEDMATAEGQVVHETDLFQLIHYTPTTAKTYERPLLIFPPWINKFYILDLRPENSMVRWLLAQGYPVFLVSWVNPEPRHAGYTFEDYMRKGIFEAVDAVIAQTGADQVNTVGYCIGGTLLASTLAYMGQTGDDRIASATFFAAQTDFSEAGDLLMFVDESWLGEIERRMDANDGVLDGQTMADTFNMLRANDLIWSFFVNNYLLGKEPKAFDLLFWNSDQTRLAKTIHLFYLDQFYIKNALAKGALELGGRRLSLGDITTPCYLQASKDDHIAPYGSVYKGAKMFGEPARFVMAGSGHIAGVINHPDAKKYQHWVNTTSPLPDDVGDWIAGATEHPGSWWPDWDGWLSGYSGAKVSALHPEKGPLKPIEPAPGRYVRVRS